MTLQEAIEARHSVRAYTEKPIDAAAREALDAFIAEVNAESGLHIFVRYDDPQGFDSRLAHYGRFRNVSNYIVLSGVETADFEQRCGYYGEKVVLFAQQLGLNTCWAALTFNRKMVRTLIPEGETMCMVISLGYGQSQGVPHRGKTAAKVIEGEFPAELMPGVEAAVLAPTAMNQQKFVFYMKDGEPAVRVRGHGAYAKVDLGIVAYHFDAVTGRKQPCCL